MSLGQRIPVLLAGVAALALAPQFTFTHGWFLEARLGDDQVRTLDLLSEETFTIAVKISPKGDPEEFKFTTRPRTLTYHLLSDWDGIDRDVLPEGEVIARRRVPGFQYGGIGATVDAVIFDDGPALEAPFEAGVYYVSACLPRGSGGGESRLAQRLANDPATRCTEPIKLQVAVRPRPDLKVDFEMTSLVRRLGPSAGRVFVGDRLSLRATVRNQGDAATAFPTQVNFLMARPGTARTIVISPERSVQIADSERVPTLDAGEEASVRIEVDSPPSRGTYRYGACVGPIRGPRIGESNLDNNCSGVRSTTFDTPPNCGWDLTIESVETPPGTVRRGQPIPVTVSVRNDGSRASPAGEVVLQQLNQAGMNQQDRVSLPSVPPGESVEVRLTVNIGVQQTGIRGAVSESVCVLVKDDCNNRNNCDEYHLDVEP